MEQQHKATYREEAYELLEELEGALLELENTPDDDQLVGKIFRAMHTIKGSGGMFGFDDIVAFTHGIETVYDMVRNGKVPVTNELISLSLASIDHIRTMVDEEVPPQDQIQNIMVGFRKLIPEQPAQQKLEKSEPKPEKPAEKTGTYRVRFRPHLSIFMNGTDPTLLLQELQELGECRIIAHLDDIPALNDLNPENCYIYWDIVLTTDQGLNSIRDVFIFVDDESQIQIDALQQDCDADVKKLGEILIERGGHFYSKFTGSLEGAKAFGGNFDRHWHGVSF